MGSADPVTVTAAVAVGDRAAADLRTAWAPWFAQGAAALVEHGASVVAWSTTNRWVDADDDGDLLVVLDGRVHGPLPAGAQAAALGDRYTSRQEDLAEGLAGDFVVVVLHRSTGTLLVARDPLGARPWYQSSRGDLHAGASEVATLVALPWVDREVDEQAAVEHLAAVTASRGRTFHRGITTLAPGMTWVHRGRSVRTHRHHDWELAPDLATSWEDAAERCREELDRAVARRLAVAGPPASELSGGLDSSAVVGTAMGLGSQGLVVGRLVFDTPRADERRWSDAVLDHWGVPTVSSPPWIPDPDEAAALTLRLARPLPDPHFLMFADLRRALLAADRPDTLTGLGGDDAFVTSGMGSVMVSAVQLRLWPVIGRAARATALRPGQAWRSLHRPLLRHLAWWRTDRLPHWVTPATAQRADLRSWFGHRPPRITRIAAIDERIANLSEGYDAAVLESQAVVADLVGARATHPFLDPQLIGATYGFDPTWPTRGDHSRALQVEAYRDRVPPVVADRRTKADFSEIFWPQVLAAPTLARVREGPLRERGWLDRAGFDALVAEARAGRPNVAIPLSRCVSLDRWLRGR